ncbi:NEW3 domain-containing protein [Thauera aromatica]|uniref:NEW3 domain-containing protein n=1 Tax=Thauera aromatica TaxID=59405 RepID=UPI001FFC506C|nr:NEW3 domain-containing protein [Thauera aromatica]MCK2094400.1 NEW3 domain-containing protein [Thauera aromatica]
MPCTTSLLRPHPSRFLSLLAAFALSIGLLSPAAHAAPESLPAAATAAGAAATLEGTLEVRIEDYPDLTHKTRHYLLTPAGERRELRYRGEPPGHLVSGTKVRARGRLADNLLALDDDSSLTQVSAAPSYSVGVQNTLVLLVNFSDNTSQPYTVSGAQSLMDTIDAFMRENSSEQATVSSAIRGWYTLPLSSATCDTPNIKTHARAAATAAGVNLSAYTRFVYVFPRISACTWAGLAIVGGSPTDAWINGAFDQKTVAHELGHNLGLGHAQSLHCDQSPIGTTCRGYEYGDIEDTMGNGRGHFSAFGKERLGWLSGAGVPPITTVEASGSYVLEPFSTAGAGGAKALKVLRGTNPVNGEQEYYYLEFRQPQGFDSVLGGVGNLTTGVTVRSANASWGAYLLDMTPNSNTIATAYDLMDGALAAGSRFTDDSAGVSIAVTWADANGAGVDVTFGQDSTCKRTAPAVLLSGPTQAVAGGTALSYTVAVSNNDSAACTSTGFSLARAVPAGWSGTLAANTLTIAPGSAASTTLTVASPASASAGTYNVSASATHGVSTSLNGSASSTYTIEAGSSSTELSATLATDKASYTLGETVASTATISTGGSPVAGASVSFTLTKADGRTVTQSVTTGNDGRAIHKYKLKRNDPAGSYRVASIASSSGKSLSNSASFTASK